MAKKHFHATLTTALCAAFSVTGAAVGQGLVFQQTVEVVNPNGAYSVMKEVSVCFDPTCPGADACDNGKPITVTMEYTGLDCSASSNTQAPDKWFCEDFGPLPDTAYIVVSKDEDCEQDIFFAGFVSVGGTYVIDGRLLAATANDGAKSLGDVASSRMAGAMGFHTQTDLGFPSPAADTLPANVYICIFDTEGGTLLQHIKFHASCSQPLFRGDQFGSARIVDAMGENEPDTNSACCNGRPTQLTMVYTGADCDLSANSQGDRFVCDQFVADLPASVYLVASRSDNCTQEVYFEGNVSIGDEYVIDSSVIGRSEFAADTSICIFDVQGGTLLQKVKFHTSCSRPLLFGDGFGGSMVVDSVGRDGDCEPPGEPCDPFPTDGLFTYTYKLTNSCGSPLGLIGYEIVVDAANVADAGFLDGPGVQPSAVQIHANRVQWHFYDMPVLPCEMSAVLYITSPFGPDTAFGSILGMAGIDTPNECVGPLVTCDLCPSDSEPCYSCPSGLGQGPPCEIPPFDCDGKVVEMTMIWDGAMPVRIKAYDGAVGSALLADIDNIQPGDEVTVGPLAGPNDSFWEIFEAGTDTLIGLSGFHRSCSDNEMNDETDCGNRQGNGKNNLTGLINDWILEGLVDEAGNVLDCGTP